MLICAIPNNKYYEYYYAEVNDEELETILIGVESLLNSRPLTAVSDDPNDGRVLTSNHFLIGQTGGDFVPESVNAEPFNPRKRWRRLKSSQDICGTDG